MVDRVHEQDGRRERVDGRVTVVTVGRGARRVQRAGAGGV